jgi:hypothetical protein
VTEAGANARLITQTLFWEKPMTTQIRIDILHGAGSVTDDDRKRAKAAALKVLNALQIDAAEAYEAYKRHTSDEDYNRSPRDTILIEAWEAAENAADHALTEQWYDPNGAACTIAA